MVVLDIAFAAGTKRISFEQITKPFIDGLGNRLALWVDHHDHRMHALYVQDARFILTNKNQHHACPELITPELVKITGQVDTVCCHIDFDGLCSAAKWVRGGVEPYPGADQDARAIDTRTGEPSEYADTIDRALRAKSDSDDVKNLTIRFLVGGAQDRVQYEELRQIALLLKPLEENSLLLAQKYQVLNDVAVVAVDPQQRYDKTLLLLAGQKIAKIAVVYDATTVTAAARFDSGIDLVQKLGLSGGMPTVVSLPVKLLPEVLEKLGQ